MIVFALAATLAMLQGGAQSPPPQGAPPGARAGQGRVTGVRAGWTIEPESVRVGDPATFRVQITAPLGTRVTFPPAVDSTSGVEPLDPVIVKQQEKNGMLEIVGSYRLLAWQPGLPEIALGAIHIEQGTATEDLQVGDARVFVTSVLPADTTKRNPKPAREIAWLPPLRWAWWALIVVGFVIAIIIGLWLQRRAKRPPPPVKPIMAAQRAFSKLNALELIDAGEPARHVGASADILRAYLAARGTTKLGLTTSELVASLAEDEVVPAHRVQELLAVADDVKFAGADVPAARAEWLGTEASAIVAEISRGDAEAARGKAALAKSTRRKRGKRRDR